MEQCETFARIALGLEKNPGALNFQNTKRQNLTTNPTNQQPGTLTL